MNYERIEREIETQEFFCADCGYGPSTTVIRLMLDVVVAAGAFYDKKNTENWQVLDNNMEQAITALKEHCDE